MSKLPYVSDASVWEATIKKGRHIKKRKNNQSGGGLSRRFRRKRFVIPRKNTPKNEAVVEQVSATAAIVDRAESELRQQKQEEQPHIRKEKPKSDGINRRKPRTKLIPIGKPKRVTMKRSKTKKHNKRQRKPKVDTEPNIFNRIRRA